MPQDQTDARKAGQEPGRDPAAAAAREQAEKAMFEALKFPMERIDGRGWSVNLRAAEQVAEALARGADPRAISPVTGLDPLMSAASIGDMAALRLLLARGADPKAQDAGGMTALMHAAGWNCGTAPGNGLGCLEELLPLADANAQDREGWTALTHAIAWGHEGAAAILAPKTDTSLRHAIDSEAAPSWGKKGETALFFAVRTTKAAFIEIVARHSDRSAANDKGLTALRAALGFAARVPFGWRGVEAIICAASALDEARESVEAAQECLGSPAEAWEKMPKAREAIARLEAQALREHLAREQEQKQEKAPARAQTPRFGGDSAARGEGRGPVAAGPAGARRL